MISGSSSIVSHSQEERKTSGGIQQEEKGETSDIHERPWIAMST